LKCSSVCCPLQSLPLPGLTPHCVEVDAAPSWCTGISAAAPSSHGVRLPSRVFRCACRRMAWAIPLCSCAGFTPSPAWRCSASAVIREVSLRTNSPRLRFSCRVWPEATVTTIASRHCFREVLRSYSVFDHKRCVLTCPPESTASGVSTPLTVTAFAIHAPIPRSKRSWSSPFEAFPSHLIPTRCRVQDESRVAEKPNGRPAILARLPLPTVQPANRFVGTSLPARFLGLAPSENSTITRGSYAANDPMLPWFLPL